jgi:hypothetical protein
MSDKTEIRIVYEYGQLPAIEVWRNGRIMARWAGMESEGQGIILAHKFLHKEDCV